MKNINVVTLALIILFTGVGFFAGTKYQASKTPTSPRMGNRPEISGSPQRMRGFNQIIGEIVSQDDTTLTVKLDDGSSKIVILSSSTTYNKSSQANLSDLKTGEKIAIFGTQNTDGTVTASSINLTPQK